MAILKPLVIIMAILIAVLVGVIAWRMAVLLSADDNQTDSTNAQSSAMTAITPVEPFDLSLGLDPSCRIINTSLSGTHLTVVTGPGAACNAVHVLDIAAGTVIGTVRP